MQVWGRTSEPRPKTYDQRRGDGVRNIHVAEQFGALMQSCTGGSQHRITCLTAPGSACVNWKEGSTTASEPP